MGEERAMEVKLVFGTVVAGGECERLQISVQGSDSIRAVKQKLAEAAGGKVTADDILLSFGPNDRKLGRQYAGDPTVNEEELRLEQYSVLPWLQRFPHWTLSARLLPAAPLPPGVAIQKAAAIAEQKNPDRAVQDARAKGDIPRISDLPAPWGPKPYNAPPTEDLIKSGYLPARFPEGWSPLVDASGA